MLSWSAGSFGVVVNMAGSATSRRARGERAAAAAYLRPGKQQSASSYAAASRSYSVQAERAKKLARGRLSSSTVRERLTEASDQFSYPMSSALGDVGEILDPADVLLGSEIAQRFRPCFEAMLPSAICPAELREAVWRLTHWTLARSDAGRLEASSLIELLVARKTPLNSLGPGCAVAAVRQPQCRKRGHKALCPVSSSSIAAADAAAANAACSKASLDASGRAAR